MTTSMSAPGGGDQPPDRRDRGKRKAECVAKATKKGKEKLKGGVQKPRRKREKVAPAVPVRRSARAGAGQRVVPAPVLTALGGTGGTEGHCGYFTRTRTWHVANATRGFIIQKIIRTFAVERYTGPGVWTAMDAVALNGYVQVPGSAVHADGTQYWELWQVADDGNIGHNSDSFSLCSIIPAAGQIRNTTRGRFTQVGEAAFYPTTVSAATLNFAVGNAAPAGVLPSRLTDPATDLATNNVVAAGPVIRYTVNVTWDSTAIDTHSRVVVT